MVRKPGRRRGRPALRAACGPAPADVSSRDAAASVAALNAAVEAVARRDPAQYQWTYKRFSLQPDGGNPYWPDCY